MLRTWLVRLSAMKLTESVRPFQVPETPGTSAWPPSLPSVPTSRATRVTSAGERRELVDHRVDGPLQLQDLALGVDRDLLRQVAVGHRRRDLGDVAHLVGQVRRHQVHALGQVPPRARDARHVRLAAELALDAHLHGDARDLVGERRELVDHAVDGVRERGDLALGVDGDLLRQVAVATAVATWAIERTWLVRLAAIRLTHSVRSAQAPDDALRPAPGRRACPPCPPRARRASPRPRRTRAGRSSR